MKIVRDRRRRGRRRGLKRRVDLGEKKHRSNDGMTPTTTYAGGGLEMKEYQEYTIHNKYEYGAPPHGSTWFHDD